MSGIVYWGALGLAVCVGWAQPPDLRLQLELARDDGATHSQIEIIRRILDEEPQNSALREELLELWLTEADLLMVADLLNKWPEAPPELAAVARARILLADDKPDEAAALLTEFLVEYPEGERATAELVQLLDARSRHRELVEFLSRSPLGDSTPEFLLQRAQAKRSVGDLDGALADFVLAVGKFPEESAVVNATPSFERLQTAQPEIAKADAALAQSPRDVKALLARSYWRRYADLPLGLALADAELAMEAQPGSVAALLSAAFSSGMPSSEALWKYSVNTSRSISLAGLAKLLEMDTRVATGEERAQALAERAFFLNAEPGQHQLALRDSDAALALEPDFPEALLEKIYALAMLRRGGEALAAFSVFEGAGPSPRQLATGLRYIAQMAFEEGLLDAALDSVDRSLSSQPTAPAYRLRAAIYERLGRSSEAEADLAKATSQEKNPSTP